MYMYSLLHPRLPPFMDEVLSEEEGLEGDLSSKSLVKKDN